ncbi:MAG: hypothetical protein M3348_11710 [Acidobacteriota bacterium]|nr:hypothetical protein [Acidobacteriota bacterium]
MNERRDDTTKPAGESRPARAPGGYYYDDATGYEVYSPEDDKDDAEDEPPGGAEKRTKASAG